MTNSVEQIYPTKGGDSSGGAGPTAGSGDGSGDATGEGDSSGSNGPGAGVIAGAVVGSVGGLALIGALVFLVRSAKQRQAMEQQAMSHDVPHHQVGYPYGVAEPYGGKPELPSDNGPAAPPPLHPSASAPGTANDPWRHPGASNLSPNSSWYNAPMPNRPELHGQQTGPVVPAPPHAPELYGQGAPPPSRPELPGQGAMSAPPPNQPELPGQGTQFHHPRPDRPELAG